MTKLTKVRSALVLSVAVIGLAVSPAIHAASPHGVPPVAAMYGHTKMIWLSLRNDSTAPVELKVGDSVMTLEPGKTKALHLPVGTRIVANSANANHTAGALLAEVSPALSDATVAIK